jgi:hypothetical protein
MIFTPHAVVGAAVGVATGNPVSGFAAGFVSHHLLDMVPHFDQGTFRLKRVRAPYLGTSADYGHEQFTKRDWIMLFIDWAIAAILFSIIFTSLPASIWPLILIGALGGITPDLIGSSPLWSPQLEEKFKSAKIYKGFHTFFHFTVPPSLIWLGIATQIVAVGLSMFFLLK